MDKISINQIKEKLQSADYESFLKIKEEFVSDDRIGVKKLIESYEKKYNQLIELKKEYNSRKMYENDLESKGYKYIAGIDEVGRGPLAGPVYAAAVILNLEVDILGIKDSKKISSDKREHLAEEIKRYAVAYSIGTASVEEIDRLNILNATKLAMKRAVESLSIKPDMLLIDAVKLSNIPIPQVSIIKGDDLSISIGAASIIAKVARDSYMDQQGTIYPEYLFEKNKGYGTKEHIEAIREYGPCNIHRKTFLKSLL